jgi:dihydroflavonol-4-reductase/farnesol dehydrogenase
MKILLTGATGFIGSYVLKFLLEKGLHVNALVRDPSKLIVHPGLKKFTGDITSIEDINNSIDGCDIVIHLAALVRASARDNSDFSKINFTGTENLLKAALHNNVKKFIFTSSMSAHSYGSRLIINEESLFKSKFYFSEYARSKAQAENLVIEYSKKGLPYIIIYPTRVFGIGPLTDANGATKAVCFYLKNKLPFLIAGGQQYSNWVFVENVAEGIIAAALSNIINEKYILGGENKTLADIYGIADNISGKKHLKINIGNKTALLLASVIELYSKLMRKHPLITKEWLKFVLEDVKVSSEKAINVLNYRITPIEEALERTIKWLRLQRFISQS